MLRAGLKAGIIMGIVVALVGVIRYLVGLSNSNNPIVAIVGCFLSLLVLVLWFVAGILATRFGPAALTAGAAVGGGALAGAVTQIIAGIVDVVLMFIMKALGLEPYVVSTEIIPPDVIRQLVQSGMPPEQIEWIISVALLTVGPVVRCIYCVGIATAIAAGLGALGGIVGRAISARRDS